MRPILANPPGPPPEWWRAWNLPGDERTASPTIAPLMAAGWEMWAVVAECEGDWPAARKAMEQMHLWRWVAGVA